MDGQLIMTGVVLLVVSLCNVWFGYMSTRTGSRLVRVIGVFFIVIGIYVSCLAVVALAEGLTKCQPSLGVGLFFLHKQILI